MQRYPLRFRCPFCPNSKVKDWPHSSCDGREEIDKDGYVWCTNCQKIFGLENMIFGCPDCPYKFLDPHRSERIYYIFKILCSINEEMDDKQFMGNLIHQVFKRTV